MNWGTHVWSGNLCDTAAAVYGSHLSASVSGQLPFSSILAQLLQIMFMQYFSFYFYFHMHIICDIQLTDLFSVQGTPMSMLLTKRNATVTLCHSKTADLASVAREADILVVAVGVPRMVTREFVKPGWLNSSISINNQFIMQSTAVVFVQ